MLVSGRVSHCISYWPRSCIKIDSQLVYLQPFAGDLWRVLPPTDFGVICLIHMWRALQSPTKVLISRGSYVQVRRCWDVGWWLQYTDQYFDVWCILNRSFNHQESLALKKKQHPLCFPPPKKNGFGRNILVGLSSQLAKELTSTRSMHNMCIRCNWPTPLVPRLIMTETIAHTTHVWCIYLRLVEFL